MADLLPAWTWPTPSAELLHYFPAEGEPSLCRRYFAGSVALMEFPRADLALQQHACKTCWKRAPEPTDQEVVEVELPCKTCGHSLKHHHKLRCENPECDYCNGWTS